MNTSQWITLTSSEIAPPVHPSDAQWSTEAPSPFDIPSHARSTYNQDTGCLEIEFKYLEHEDLSTVRLDAYFTAKVGKKTKRIWQLCFDVDAFAHDSQKIASAAKSSVEKAAGVSNGDIAGRAIFLKGQALLQPAFR